MRKNLLTKTSQILAIIAFIAGSTASSLVGGWGSWGPRHPSHLGMTLSAQRIGHISHSSEPRGKSSHVKVKYMLNNHCLLALCKLPQIWYSIA
jgi:hypothetical protein